MSGICDKIRMIALMGWNTEFCSPSLGPARRHGQCQVASKDHCQRPDAVALQAVGRLALTMHLLALLVIVVVGTAGCSSASPVSLNTEAATAKTHQRIDPQLPLGFAPRLYAPIPVRIDWKEAKYAVWLPQSRHVAVIIDEHIEIWRAPERALTLDTPLDARVDSPWLPQRVAKTRRLVSAEFSSTLENLGKRSKASGEPVAADIEFELTNQRPAQSATVGVHKQVYEGTLHVDNTNGTPLWSFTGTVTIVDYFDFDRANRAFKNEFGTMLGRTLLEEAGFGKPFDVTSDRVRVQATSGPDDLGIIEFSE